MRRFMPQQSNKLRGIDGRFSGRNACCFAKETIYTSSPDFVGAVAKTSALLFDPSCGAWHGKYGFGVPPDPE